ncbi:MAG: hypothetical protein HY764_02790 [Candidatus Portnoybacteria bacterium]|nr:hypothetical protein [Candidatus Portnoybacteria bacterium]
MDFKKLFFIIKKSSAFIIIFTILVIIAVLGFSWLRSGGYNVSLAISVFSKSSQATADYQYDGYYSIKAANDFCDTLSQWIKSPEVTNSVYKEADIGENNNSWRKIPKALQAKKMAPQYIEVNFKVSKADDASKISRALDSVLKEKTENASRFSDTTFTIIVGEPIISKNQANFIFNGFIAFVGGAFVAITLVLFKENDYWN